MAKTKKTDTLDKLVTELFAACGLTALGVANWSNAAFRAVIRIFRNVLASSFGLVLLALLVNVTVADLKTRAIAMAFIYYLNMVLTVRTLGAGRGQRLIHAAGFLASIDTIANSFLNMRGLSVGEKSSPLLKVKLDLKKSDKHDPSFELGLLKESQLALRTILIMFSVAIHYLTFVRLGAAGFTIGLLVLPLGINWMIRHRPMGFDFLSWYGSFNGYAFLGLTAFLFCLGTLNLPQPVAIAAGIAAFVLITMFASGQSWIGSKHYAKVALALIALIGGAYLYSTMTGPVHTGSIWADNGLFQLPFLSPEVNRMLFRPSPYYAWGLAAAAFLIAVVVLNTSKNAVITTAAGALWIAAVAYGYFIAIPASNWTPTMIQEQAIEAEYREATTLHGREMRQTADPVVGSFTTQGGTVHTDPAALKASLFDQARKAHQFNVDLDELKATARGINVGDFTVDAQIPNFVDVGKKVCRGQWLEAWGQMDPRPGNDNYAHHVEAIGQDPLTNAYDGFQKLVERAPLGALVVSFDGRYQFDWQPLGEGHYGLTPNVDGCQYIKAVVNGWIRGTEPTYRNFHGQHTGGFSVRIHQD